MSTGINDCRTRKWLITQNNPEEHDITQQDFVDKLTSSKRFTYLCCSREVGESGTPHIHCFVKFSSAVKMSHMKRWFPFAHFDVARGTSSDNRDYVFKLGKWVKDKKAETNIVDSHIEVGECPIERQGSRSDLEDFISMVEDGSSNYEIIKEIPRFALDVKKIDDYRASVMWERYKNVYRKMDVTYIVGPTRVGKSRYVMEKYGYENVYRISDYKHPFDEYNYQDVIIFDEFRSSLPLTAMLNYLDGYPLSLPVRFQNKPACFTKVYIISNEGLSSQYSDLSLKQRDTYDAWIARIHHVKWFHLDGTVTDMGSGHDALYNFLSAKDDGEELPFNE